MKSQTVSLRPVYPPVKNGWMFGPMHWVADLPAHNGQESSPWLTVTEAADFLQCGRTKLYSMMQGGRVPYQEFDGQRRVRRDDLVELTRRGTRKRRSKT